MKALTRNAGEMILETDNIEGLDWRTGAPLTTPLWCGGPYRLIEDAVLVNHDLEIEDDQ